MSEERGCCMSHSLPPPRPLGKALPLVDAPRRLLTAPIVCINSAWEQRGGIDFPQGDQYSNLKHLIVEILQ